MRPTQAGYLRHIALGDLAEQVGEGTLVRLPTAVGAFVTEEDVLAEVWPRSAAGHAVGAIRRRVAIGTERDLQQDVLYGVRQLAEIAMKALSPGVNDPFTAITCVDRLGSALCRLARRDVPSPCRYDEHKRLRIVAPPSTFPGIVDAAFNQIRQYSRSSTAVAIRLLDTIAAIAAAAHRPEDRNALRRHAGMIARGAREDLPEAGDRQAVEERYEASLRALGG